MKLGSNLSREEIETRNPFNGFEWGGYRKRGNNVLLSGNLI
jgi:hypothetical protein